MTKVTPFLMFKDQLEAAMGFYTATFPDSEIRKIARTGKVALQRASGVNSELLKLLSSDSHVPA